MSTPTMLDIQCIAILTTAASSSLGLVLRTSDAAKARAALYNARKLLSDPSLASLSVRVSPNDSEHELWLLTNRTETVNIR
jgi:hypothetical protein